MHPMDITATMIILGLAGAWLLQLFLSYFQLRRFMGGSVSSVRRAILSRLALQVRHGNDASMPF